MVSHQCLVPCGSGARQLRHPERQETEGSKGDPTEEELTQWLFAVFQETGG